MTEIPDYRNFRAEWLVWARALLWICAVSALLFMAGEVVFGGVPVLKALWVTPLAAALADLSIAALLAATVGRDCATDGEGEAP